jgi:hypothetical protein
MNIKPVILLGSALLPGLAHAESPAAPAVPSVQENMVAMDTNKDGMITVSEVRAFIEAKHGKGYEKSLLDKMEASTSGLSCATPFANRFY